MRLRAPHRWLLNFAILATAIALAGTDASAAKKSKPTDKFYEHAIELIAKGDYRGAITELKIALQADPKDIAARVLLGNTYLEVEDGAAAAREFLRAREDGAGNSFILVPLGRAYILQGHFNKALEELRTARKHHAAAAETATTRGDAYLALLAYRNAEVSYLEASKLRPKDARPLIGLARVKLAIDDMAGARSYIKRALEADPKDPHGWSIQGEVAELQGNRTEAEKHYSRAIELAPKFSQALLSRAAIRIDQGRYDEAEPDILAVRNADSRNPRAAYLLSLVLAQRGELKAARKLLAAAEKIRNSYPESYMLSHPPSLLLGGVATYFRDDFGTSHRLLSIFLKRVPHHGGARKLLASIALTRNEPEEAILYLDPLGPRSSTDIDVLIMYGGALGRLKRYREASSILKRAEVLVEPGSSSLFRLVAVRLRSGQSPEAIKILKSELDRDPDAAQATILLAAARMRQGDFQSALKALNAVTERRPGNAVAHNLAGVALLGLGDVEASRKRYQAAVNADPNNMHATENLAKVELRLGNLDNAVELFSTILERDSGNGSAMISLAEISRLREDVDESIRWLEKARSSSRNSQDAAVRLVDLYIGESRPEDALFVARQLHDQHPGEFEYIVFLGRTQLNIRKLKQAHATFKRLATLAEEKKSAARLHEAATWQVRARDINGARESLGKVIVFDGKHVRSYVLLFRLDMVEGNLGGATSWAQKVISLDDTVPTGHMLIGDVSMRQRQYDAAILAYDKALGLKELPELVFRAFNARRAAGRGSFEFAEAWAAKRPDDPMSQRLLATAHADAGRFGDAVEIYNRLLQKAPNSPPLLNNIALLYQKAGDSRAIEFAKRAYDAAPTSETMDTYGWILVRAGRIDEGLPLLRDAKLRAPKVPEIRYHLAVALNAQGRKEAARRELREALLTGLSFEGKADAQALWAKLTSDKR